MSPDINMKYQEIPMKDREYHWKMNINNEISRNITEYQWKMNINNGISRNIREYQGISLGNEYK